MEKKIIGLVGETGSGKDTFCNFVEKNFSSVKSLRFSDVLTNVLGLFFDEIKKEDQQWLASVLRDRFGEDILMKGVAKSIKQTKEEIVLVNGIRVKEELGFIQSLGGRIVYITLDPKRRWERVRERGEKKDDNISYEKFLEIDSGRTEKQIKELGEKADFILENTGEKMDFQKKILALFKKI